MQVERVAIRRGAMPQLSKLWPASLRHLGLIGAFASSAANFILAFTLQRHATPDQFGTYALLQVMLQFGISVSNALFCSPVVVAIGGGERDSVVPSFAKANTAFCLLATLIVCLETSRLHSDPWLIVSVATLCFLSWMRWFFRAVELAGCNFKAPALADLVYSVFVGVPAVCMMMGYGKGVTYALAIQAAGCAAAFLALSSTALACVRGSAKASWTPFVKSLRTHGSWALAGVVTTEATANAHSWVVGFLLGPAVLAPIAAVNLFFRPVVILTQALTQYERPRMAMAIGAASPQDLDSHRLTFTRLSLLCWGCNTAVVAAILYLMPSALGDGQYPLGILWALAGVIVVTYLARTLRSAESAALQAAGLFRPLALVTMVTAPFTMFAAIASAVLFPTCQPMVMGGVLLGEVATCVLIRRVFRHHLTAGMGNAL